jgi:long-chain acyl-CoA synthetase
MIVVSGFNVYPAQIEEVISKHPLVDKVCVIGIPHSYKMHVPKAIIVLKKGITENPKIIRELKDLCKEQLSVYSQPKEFEFRDNLPKTLYNKIDYKKLEKENNE